MAVGCSQHHPRRRQSGLANPKRNRRHSQFSSKQHQRQAQTNGSRLAIRRLPHNKSANAAVLATMEREAGAKAEMHRRVGPTGAGGECDASAITGLLQAPVVARHPDRDGGQTSAVGGRKRGVAAAQQQQGSRSSAPISQVNCPRCLQWRREESRCPAGIFFGVCRRGKGSWTAEARCKPPFAQARAAPRWWGHCRGSSGRRRERLHDGQRRRARKDSERAHHRKGQSASPGGWSSKERKASTEGSGVLREQSGEVARCIPRAKRSGDQVPELLEGTRNWGSSRRRNPSACTQLVAWQLDKHAWLRRPMLPGAPRSIGRRPDSSGASRSWALTERTIRSFHHHSPWAEPSCKTEDAAAIWPCVPLDRDGYEHQGWYNPHWDRNRNLEPAENKVSSHTQKSSIFAAWSHSQRLPFACACLGSRCRTAKHACLHHRRREDMCVQLCASSACHARDYVFSLPLWIAPFPHEQSLAPVCMNLSGLAAISKIAYLLLRARWPLRAVRVGEASNPGPESQTPRRRVRGKSCPAAAGSERLDENMAPVPGPEAMEVPTRFWIDRTNEEQPWAAKGGWLVPTLQGRDPMLDLANQHSPSMELQYTTGGE